jgi:hypothetical protein
MAELGEVDGMAEILDKFKEFHKAARGMLKNRTIAADQPQAFSYDDRMEPRRIRDFVMHFYTGDINEAFAQAIEYHYVDKLESEEDKAKIRELTKHVIATVVTRRSNRRGLNRESERVRTMPENIEGQMWEAKNIMGPDFIGPDEIKNAFGIEISPDQIPKIPFSIDDLERAKSAGQFLVLRVGPDDLGKTMTLDRLEKILRRRGIDMLKASANWIRMDNTFESSSLSASWALTSKEPVKDSFGKSYQQQTGILIRHLKRDVFKGKPLPKKYASAVAEFKRAKKTLSLQDRQQQAVELSRLSITSLLRPSLLELLYDIYAYQMTHSSTLLSKHMSWTKELLNFYSPRDKSFVSVGPNALDGVSVSNKRHHNASHGALGAIFSRTS